jgi:beta-phosphoglucomutase family hydrolase
MDLNWNRYRAVLFDLDGVLTPTAVVHRKAWKRGFDEFLATRSSDEAPFTDDDYYEHVDGKPRYDGVRDFLASRDIHLPEGLPSDGPTEVTVCGVGNAKNEAFTRVLEEDGVDPYPGSMALVDHLESIGVAMAVVSSSANARTVLQAAGLEDRFPVIIDGRVARAEGIPGKPAPDMFLEAARRLAVDPADAVVVEDAISGVQAGRAGPFGLVIGVAREGDAASLTQAGADLVIEDLGETVRS